MTDTREEATGILARIAQRAADLEERDEMPDMYEPQEPSEADLEARRRAESALPRGDRSE